MCWRMRRRAHDGGEVEVVAVLGWGMGLQSSCVAAILAVLVMYIVVS